MGFFKGALKIALAIFLSVVALAVVGWLAMYAYQAHEKSNALPYQAVKHWAFDASEHLGMKFDGKTKLLDGRLYADFRFDGHPPYLKNPANTQSNSNASITVQFNDKDGFKVFAKPVSLRDFATVVDKGVNSGLAFEFDEYLSVESYARFSQVTLAWNLDTAIPKSGASDPATGKPIASAAEPADHCAPNISKPERLRRLSHHGLIRETGLNEYSAGNRSITFLNSSELLQCK